MQAGDLDDLDTTYSLPNLQRSHYSINISDTYSLPNLQCSHYSINISDTYSLRYTFNSHIRIFLILIHKNIEG